MPQFTYTGNETRYYPSLGITAKPGAKFTLPKMPVDGRWEPTAKASAVPAETTK